MIRNFLFSLLSISLLLLTGCSADEPIVVPGADGRTSINLLIPSSELALENTRATDTNPLAQVDAAEGVIKNLSVVGFYKDGDTDRHFFYELTDEAAVNVDNIYRSYKIAVVPADYQLYVLANVTVGGSLYNDLKGSTTRSGLENDVKAYIHTYSALPKAATGLPMAKHLEAKVKADQETQVVVNLEYVCSKVRLTVIYNNAFNANFKVDGLDVVGARTENKVFQSVSPTGGSAKTYTNVGGTHYNFPAGKENWTIQQWTNLPTNSSDDPLNGFTDSNKKEGTGGWSSFVWQSTQYVPECLGLGTSATKLTLKTAKGNKDIYVGCSTTGNKHDTNVGGDIRRGNFYDIVAMVTDAGEIEYKYNVLPWNLENIIIQLAGESRLYVGKTVIPSISGESPVEIDYRTSVNKLDFKSCEITIAGKTYEAFDISEDKASGNIIVNLNGDLPLQAAPLRGDDMGFWVVAGSIRKWIAVEEIDLRAYVRILPKTRTLSIQNIVNEADYPLWFDYATNGDNLTLTLTSYTNTNEQKGTLTEGTELKGISVELCAPDSTALSQRVDLQTVKNTYGGDFFQIPKLSGTDSYPDDGFIKLMINDPTDARFFSKEIKATFKAAISNTGVTAATAELDILPNPTVYTIHFKAINGTNWDNPHIYVYQPLTYNGYPVFGWTGSQNINWLEYDFTGNRAFKGWKKDGGSIDNLAASRFNTAISFGGENVSGYKDRDKDSDGGWGNPGTELKDDYYQTVRLTDYSKATCSQCNTSGNGILWPGIGMTRETGENDGWWKIELPLLAKPDKALVMFTNTHSDVSARYPEDNMPGIALPNYSDREAWYLLDQARGGKKCSFSDDRREEYPRDPEKICIYWSSNDFGGSGSFHFFNNSTGSNVQYWPASGNETATKNGSYYYYILSTETELKAFDQLVSGGGNGYVVGSVRRWWNNNKHGTVISGKPDWLNISGITRSVQIWEN
ncbi:MAG: hypothetical protein K2G67_01525 [Muribaculaceae bacterium]|nr:hypothetical protein [Muribaculaceae bacterium]